MTRLYKTLRRAMDKAIHDYRMIEKGDRLLVGVSGGSDSLSLLKLLYEKCVYGSENFTCAVVHVDLGFDENESRGWQKLEAHFKELGVDYRIVHTQIYRQTVAPTARKNPCFLCSLHRRKKVYEVAYEQRCNKIAYGHHKDDIVETLLINILYGRKIEAMNPVQDVFRGKMQIIRPLAYIEETLLKKFALESQLPILPKSCPVDSLTRRQKVKEIIARLQREEKNADIRENIFKSLSHVNIHFAPWVKRL